jgi:nucleoid-associated protein YgaU
VADTPDPDPVVSSQQATQQATAQDVPVVQDESAVEMALAEPSAAEPTSPQATLPLASPVDRPETPEGPLPDQLAAPGAAEAPAVILSTEAGVEVLQAGGGPPQALDQIALDAITYEDAGSVVLSGRGAVDEFVRVYIDNEPVQTTVITPDGRWRADLPNVDSGPYTLRVDAVDSEGTVISRVESPFLREDPVLLAQAIERGEAAATVQVVTVQPGNTLWAIARDRYGEGPAYVRVFEANRDRIRDPDLIYPGQVFSIPN